MSPFDQTTDVGFPCISAVTLNCVGMALPNFVQQQTTQSANPAISASPDGCVGFPITFSGTPTSIIDIFQWSILDPGSMVVYTSTAQADTFTPVNAGTYTLSMNLTNRCGLNTTISETVEIFANPPPPEFLMVVYEVFTSRQ